MDVLGHVSIQYIERGDVWGASAPPWDFAVLDTSQFVILLPEIGFEDFDRAQESENGLIPLIKIAACRCTHVLCEDLLWYAIRQECGTNSPYGRHANSLLQK